MEEKNEVLNQLVMGFYWSYGSYCMLVMCKVIVQNVNMSSVIALRSAKQLRTCYITCVLKNCKHIHHTMRNIICE